MYQLSRYVLLALLLALPCAIRAGDPFDKKNEIPTAKTPEPPKPPAIDFGTQGLVERIRFPEVKLEPSKVRPGETVKLVVTGKLKDGWYTYPITQQGDFAGFPLQVTYKGDPKLKPLWPISESVPKVAQDEVLGVILKHVKEFTFSQEILVDPSATPGEKTLDLHMKIQICGRDDPTGGDSCRDAAAYPAIPVKIQVEGTPVPLTAELQKRLAMKKPEPKLVGSAAPKAAAQNPPDGTTKPKTDVEIALEGGLLGLLGAAALGALLMLVTPCVFPMIPITVNFFLKQSEKEHHNPLATASVYCGTIIVVLTLIVLSIGSVVATWAVASWFNLVMGIVLMYFALSLFGMYEIELPSWLAQWTSSRETQGGYAGAVFMALTFTITSFTCTGPFLAALITSIGALQLPWWQVALAALVYSATFAAPFFVLALFPRLLKSLPKSGGWLNAVKVTMGFLEVALAVKFLSIVDVNWFRPTPPQIFTYDVVLCLWIGLSVLTGLYLLGCFRLPHDDPQEHIGVVRMLFALFFLGFAVYLTPLLQGPNNKPAGFLGDNIASFLPEDFRDRSGPGNTVAAKDGKKVGPGGLAWADDYEQGWKEAVRDNKLIFIDFTGVHCSICRINEQSVFPNPDVRAQLEKYTLVKLYTDVVVKPGLTGSESDRLAARNTAWRNTLGSEALPAYFVFRPDPKTPFTPDGKLNGKTIGLQHGQINDREGFVRFLSAPLQAAVAQK